jgi:Flp pilus assembly protein TadG
MQIWPKNDKSHHSGESGSFLTRLRRDSRGNTLAMAGAALVPITGMIGSGLDMSRAYMAQAKLQNACDAAALAARREMSGETWTASARAEGERFFDFNYPAGTMDSQNVTRTVAQSTSDGATVTVTASADVPTTVMSMFGRDTIPITVECDANQDYGNNDIMVVLDVTGSMNWYPGTSYGSGGPGTKIDRLRDGAIGLYRALSGATNTRTRFGFMPYSMTVNVGHDLTQHDFLHTTYYWQERQVCSRYRRNGRCRRYRDVYDLWDVSANDAGWTNINQWRRSGDACIEERPTVGNAAHEIVISQSVSQADIDDTARNAADHALQWGRYDPSQVEDDDGNNVTSYACPAQASRLQVYGNETEYQNEVTAATARVGGNTYHDIGITWAARYLSSTGMFSSDNPEMYNNVPVAKHIIYLTDGILSVSSRGYSAYGYERERQRLEGSESQNARHVAHFHSVCNRAKSMGMTVWVIALDVADTSDIEPCATSTGHFYVSDGSDLEDVFERIGAGIGRLRLTE